MPRWQAERIGALVPWTPPGAAYDSGQTIGAGIEEGSPGTVGLGTLGVLASLPFAVRPPVRPATRIASPIRAYHGSPHQFDEFDISRIGTGEGAQAYGHGLYFAEAEPVARSYRDRLTGDAIASGRLPAPTLNGRPLFNADDEFVGATGNAFLDRVFRNEAFDAFAARDTLRAYIERGGARISQEAAAALRHLDALEDSGALLPRGHMYEVALHARPEQFLDWDAPLSRQQPGVREALGRVLAEARGGPVGDSFYGSFGESGSGLYNLVSAWTRHHPESTAGALRGAGIPGIRYLDQGSRTAGAGSHNYVVLDPSIIEILRRYGILGPIAGIGAASTLMGDQ
jgi:hypothetical protein